MRGQEVSVGSQLVFEPATGVVRFLRRGRVLLDHVSAAVVYTSAGGQRKKAEVAGRQVTYGLARDGASLSVADGEVELTWLIFPGEETHVRLEAKNIGSQPVRVGELHVLDVTAERGGTFNLGGRPGTWRFFQNGWQSWTPAFVRDVANGTWVNPNTADYRTKHQPHGVPNPPRTLSSEWFTVIAPPQGDELVRSPVPAPALLLGFTTTADQLSEVQLDLNGSFHSLRAIAHADGWLLSPGAKVTSETLLLASDSNPNALLDLYAARLGEAMHARVPNRAPSGWCSWYYFYGEETADDVLANLGVMQTEQLPLDVVLIDDGYETAIGDWLDVSGEKYPQGMQFIARQISETGRRLGIWAAPFGASATSKLLAAHPDWVLRDEQGQPVLAWKHWGVDVFALDVSLPAVQSWLRETFRTLAEEWGVEFFKVDFLFAAALPGVRHDPHMTRAGALRRGLEIIRAAIGERFLLGCGAPLGPAVGLVDAMRVGTDVSINWKPFWQDLSEPATSNAVLNTITRSFMHRRLWLNDPDCLLVRPSGRDSNLTLSEMRTLTTAVGLSGGLVVDGDSLTQLPPSRLKYLKSVLPAFGRSAVPVDLFRNERPGQLVLPVQTSWGSWTMVALMNWEQRSCTTRVRLSELGLPSRAYHAYDYWRRRYLGLLRDEIVIPTHRPHETVLLLLKPPSEKPQLLASTFHIAGGAVEVKDVRLSEGRLVVEMEKAGQQAGQLVFAVPEKQRVTGALANGQPLRTRQISPGIWETRFTLSGTATVELMIG